MASTKVSLRLLIDNNDKKVLYAEAGKEFIDFLFNLLSLPVGTIIRLLTKNGMVGCLGNLYESIENLNESYIQPDVDKDILLKPGAEISGLLLLANNDLLLQANNDDGGPRSPKIYMCGRRCNYNVADDNRTVCPQCRATMTYEVPFVGKRVVNEVNSCEGGFVKGVVTYMVMDDLIVQPMSTISGITLLNRFNVKGCWFFAGKGCYFGHG